MRVLSLAAAALLILGLASGLALWRYANSKLDRTEIAAIEANRDATPQTDADGQPVEALDTMNVLVVGSDSREGLSDQKLLELGTEDTGTKLTDTLMLVQLSPRRDQAAVVGFPRDLRVEAPGEGVTKINAVHAKGGPDLLVRTVQDLVGVDVDHYVEVNIAGFLELTDAIGGVEVCIEEPMKDDFAGVDLPAGCQTLDGVDAAGFVRSRRVRDEFGADNDFGRIARQQYFISQAMDEVTSAGTLANPIKVKRLIDAVAGAITTDKDLGAPEMLRLANSLKTITSDSLEMRTIPSYYSNETGFAHVYEDEAEVLFSALREGTALAPDVGTEGPSELTPADVSLVVLNGEGTEGLASEAEAFLTGKGFTVVSTGNAGPEAAPDFTYETTEVAYGPGDEAKAQLVASYLPGAELVEADDLTGDGDVRVTIGSDWNER